MVRGRQRTTLLLSGKNSRDYFGCPADVADAERQSVAPFERAIFHTDKQPNTCSCRRR